MHVYVTKNVGRAGLVRKGGDRSSTAMRRAVTLLAPAMSAAAVPCKHFSDVGRININRALMLPVRFLVTAVSAPRSTAVPAALGRLCSLDRPMAPPAMTAARGFKNKAHTNPRPNKTKKAVLKRFILTGKGRLKYGHDGKSHLNRGKSKSRMRRLGQKGILSGTMAKNMKSLILTGK